MILYWSPHMCLQPVPSSAASKPQNKDIFPNSCAKNSSACLALYLQFLFLNAAISLCRVNLSREMRKDTVCWTVCAVHAFRLFILYNWTLQCQNHRHMHLWCFIVSRWLLANVLPWNCVTLLLRLSAWYMIHHLPN